MRELTKEQIEILQNFSEAVSENISLANITQNTLQWLIQTNNGEFSAALIALLAACPQKIIRVISEVLPDKIIEGITDILEDIVNNPEQLQYVED